jgi:multidrug resistance efflux pump
MRCRRIVVLSLILVIVGIALFALWWHSIHQPPGGIMIDSLF